MTTLQVIDQEIPIKGKCYVICTAYDAIDFDVQMANVVEAARQRGARWLHFACRDTTRQFDGETYKLGGQMFHYDTTFDILQKTLATSELSTLSQLRVKPLRQSNAPLYIALHNESFFEVPNGQTIDLTETDAILADEKRSAGFFMLGGEPLGTYEIDRRSDMPEIAALSIRPEYRKQGYGALGLQTLETLLAAEGNRMVQLLVARSNKVAYTLYLANGYWKQRVLSRWFYGELWSERVQSPTDCGLLGNQKVF